MAGKAEKNHMDAESAVSTTSAVPMAPASCSNHCPALVSAAARSMSTNTPSFSAAQPMDGRKAVPTDMARLVSLLDRSCSVLATVLLRVSNSACMEPA